MLAAVRWLVRSARPQSYRREVTIPYQCCACYPAVPAIRPAIGLVRITTSIARRTTTWPSAHYMARLATCTASCPWVLKPYSSLGGPGPHPIHYDNCTSMWQKATVRGTGQLTHRPDVDVVNDVLAFRDLTTSPR